MSDPPHESAASTAFAGRRPIRVLDESVVERIAAGEVIERPASVVRELIENALDAGATSVRVELRDGGLRLVRATDDGWGIPPAEIELAVMPHATSKLHDLSDLVRLRTLGFRGEALASIAAVAEVQVTSAGDAEGVAQTLIVRGGQVIERRLDARPQGTTVAVRDLFASIPARRATLRGARAEEARALAVLRAYALAHPAVRFVAIVDGGVAFQTPGMSPEAAVAAVFGADIAQALLPIGPAYVDGAEISGWIAPRMFTRPSRDYALLCVNGRPIANHSLHSALEAGYRPVLRKGRHPIALVSLTVEPSDLDTNVHPAKSEVLVRSERVVLPALREIVHVALGSAPAEATHPPLAGSGPGSSWGTAGAYGRTRQTSLPSVRRRRGRHIGEPRPLYAASANSDAAGAPAGPVPALEALGQLDNALVVARSAGGDLYLVDQHRAHERLLYETLQRLRPPGTHPESAPVNAVDQVDLVGDSTDAHRAVGRGQILLEPLIVQLSPRQAQLLNSRLQELSQLGLVCEPFGGATFLVRAVPALPGAAISVASFAQELAGDAAEDADSWFDHVRISLACRGALRRGQSLDLSEQQALLIDLHTAKAPAVCPHGSPIVLRYSQRFLASVFEW